jgi:hypothetical protein
MLGRLTLPEPAMSLPHAIVWTDHHSARVVQFDTEQFVTKKVAEQTHETPQHNSEVRSEHEFLGAVCDALDGVNHVLITGSHTAIADFKHYVEKHRAPLAKLVIGYEVVDHPTDNQLVALGREQFKRYARMN